MKKFIRTLGLFFKFKGEEFIEFITDFCNNFIEGIKDNWQKIVIVIGSIIIGMFVCYGTALVEFQFHIVSGKDACATDTPFWILCLFGFVILVLIFAWLLIIAMAIALISFVGFLIHVIFRNIFSFLQDNWYKAKWFVLISDLKEYINSREDIHTSIKSSIMNRDYTRWEYAYAWKSKGHLNWYNFSKAERKIVDDFFASYNKDISK